MKKLRLQTSSIRFKYWLLMVSASVVVVGFGFIAQWQSYRNNGFDPQVQYTQDIASALEQGATPQALGGSNPVDPRKSLGLFLMVTDKDHKVLASTLSLDAKKTPVPSDKNFDAAKKNQQRFLWKPHADASTAVVMQHYGDDKKGGFVLVGRSAKEVDQNIQNLALLALGAFLALTALSTIAVRIGRPQATATPKVVEPLQPLTFEEEKLAEPLPEESAGEEKSASKKKSSRKKSSKARSKK